MNQYVPAIKKNIPHKGKGKDLFIFTKNDQVC
ncbi:hypothetical protein GGQ95_002890 [Anoxybacillus rupiensis]|nr:hypothetical protein [Anoxybacillus rupiensis]